MMNLTKLKQDILIKKKNFNRKKSLMFLNQKWLKLI